MPEQYVVMRPSNYGPDWYKFVRSVWWSGSRVDLWKSLHRVDKSVVVFSVKTANELFSNVGPWNEQRKVK